MTAGKSSRVVEVSRIRTSDIVFLLLAGLELAAGAARTAAAAVLRLLVHCAGGHARRALKTNIKANANRSNEEACTKPKAPTRPAQQKT